MGSTMVPFLSCFLWLLTRPKCSLIGPFLCMMRRGDNNPKQLATPSEVNGPWSPPAQGSKTWGSKTFSRAWPWSWANYYWTWTLNGLGPVTYADLFFSFFFFCPSIVLSCLEIFWLKHKGSDPDGCNDTWTTAALQIGQSRHKSWPWVLRSRIEYYPHSSPIQKTDKETDRPKKTFKLSSPNCMFTIHLYLVLLK